MEQLIRVLIADDHDAVRRGIRALLATEPGIEVVGEARNGQEAITKARQTRPDVVLMDHAMPGVDGLAATRQIATSQPEVRILILSSYHGESGNWRATVLRAGARGYLPKDGTPEELVRAILLANDSSRLRVSVGRCR
jgi:DNA-binding NarL/FixJ family response regulator